jgi:hypothetical protein
VSIASSKVPFFVRQALIILLITFVLAEVSLRAYNYIQPSPIFFSKSYNRFRPPPFSSDYDDFKLNSKGFKDVEFRVQKSEGDFRILGIGDSFAFGVVPYSYNYLTLLEDGLKLHGRKVELINMGIPGTGPIDYLSLLINEGLELGPDMVLVSFFTGNDFLQQQEKTYSYVVALIKYVIDLNTKVAGPIVHGDGAYDDSAPTFTDEAYLHIEKLRSLIFRKQNRKFQADFEAAFGHVLRMKEICDRRGIKFFVVLIPDELQIDPVLQRRVLDQWNMRSDVFDFELPNHLLRSKFEEYGIDYIDLLDPLLSEAKGKRLYRVNDSHWNIAGNEVASRLILEHLLALVP